MKCLVMKLSDSLKSKHEEAIEHIHTLDEFAELVNKLGGSVQVSITPKGWIIDDFRKLLKGK